MNNDDIVNKVCFNCNGEKVVESKKKKSYCRFCGRLLEEM